MNWEKIHSIYFIGIGGIGMSALARHFNHLGKSVSGYDRTRTELTKQLEAENISIHYEVDINQIPHQPDLVVYTPAISKDQKELKYCMEKGFKIMKRAEVLGLIAQSHYSIGIAGTHGKTTVSCVLAQTLHQAGMDAAAFLGGISLNINSNYQPGNEIAVVEADEYDKSFHHLHPNISVVTSMDSDHLEVYGNHEGMVKGFKQYVHQTKQGGHLILHHSLTDLIQFESTLTYSLYNQNADVYTQNLTIKEGEYLFDVRYKEEELNGFHCCFGGKHNVENALVAVAAGKLLGLNDEAIVNGVSSFIGVKRRFEYQLRKGITYIDDYAHHPKEISALLSSIKELYANKRITAIFQPHLYSRTRDYGHEFAQSLDVADEVILLPIYPAREEPMEGVTSQIILNALSTTEKSLVGKNELCKTLKKNRPEVVVSIGAGDIDTCVPMIKDCLKNQLL